MKRHSYTAVFFFWFLCILPACATPPSVLQLAEKTAANVGVISAQINRLAQQSQDLANSRAANIARLHAANASVRARYNYDKALTEKSEDKANLDEIVNLEDWGKKVEEIFQASVRVEKERKEAILATQKQLTTKSSTLSQIAQALSTLAKEEPSRDRVKFLAGYAKNLKNEIDAQLQQDNKSAKNANALLEKLKNQF